MKRLLQPAQKEKVIFRQQQQNTIHDRVNATYLDRIRFTAWRSALFIAA